MKKIAVVLISMLVVYACGETPETKSESAGKSGSPATALSKSPDIMMKRYDVKSGIVEYQTSTSGNIMGLNIAGKGTKKLIFKDYGATEIVEEKKTERTMGEVTQTHSLTKFDKGIVYTVDFDAKTIIKGDERGVYKVLSGGNASMKETGEKMMKSLGGEKVGEGNVLSYTCDIYELMGQKVWIYKGITLRTEGNMMGVKTSEIAVKVDFESHIPDNYFNLPDFPLQEMTGVDPDVEMGKDDKTKLQEIKNMSFEDFKKMAKDDEELGSMTEKDLRKTYEMMKKMASVMPGK